MIYPARYLVTGTAIFLLAMSSHAKTQEAPSAISAVNVEEANASFEFSYSYPAQAAAIPKLARWLGADQAKSRKELTGWAKDGMADAKANKYEYRPYAQGTHWEAAGDNGQFLSLAASFNNYTGGAHGNYGFRFLLWDRKASKALGSYGDVFTKGSAALTMLRKDYCAALDKERAERRGKEWDREAGSPFDECPAFAELSIGFTGKPGQPFNMVELIAGPYVAGSYAEGAYEITLPVSAAILAAIKPQYRSAFSAQ